MSYVRRNPVIEQALVEFHNDAKERGVSYPMDIYQHEAQKVAQDLGISNFKASLHYITTFGQRHGISSKRLHGEAGDADYSIVPQFYEEFGKVCFHIVE